MIYDLTTSRNFDNVIRSTPEEIGPGSYNVRPKFGNKKKMKAPFGSKITSREIFPRPELDVPSPGEYEAKPLTSSIVIGSVFDSESPRKFYNLLKTPSPADYCKIDDWTKNPPRPLNKKSRTPKPHSGFIGQDVTCYTVNQNGEWVPVKKVLKGPEYLGPGTYSPIEYPTNYKITMDTSSKREVFVDKRNIPDPCKYSPNTRKSDRIPVAIRELSRKTHVDGGEPVFVNLNTWVPEREGEGSPAFKSRQNRKPFPDPEPTPSPVVYYHPSKRNLTPGNSFGHRMERTFTAIQPKLDSPGPGQYNGKTINWIKGTNEIGPRSVTVLDYHEKTPGPGSYIKLDKWKKDRPSSVFQSRVPRIPGKVEVTPGAADYSPVINDKERAIPPSIHEARSDTLGDSWVEKSKLETPAPVEYQNIESDYGKGITIPYKYRDDDSDNKVPGPGTYNVVHKSFQIKSYNSHVYPLPDD